MESNNISIEESGGLSIDDCRRLILGSEPWLTLGYGDADIKGIVEAAETGRVLVAKESGNVIGFTLSITDFLFGEYLKVMAIDPEFRNQGVGRQLIEELEKRVFRMRRNLYLCVSDFNWLAQKFYEQLGFTKVGMLPDLIKKGSAEILLRKTTGPVKLD